jgi:hypothetical protein
MEENRSEQLQRANQCLLEAAKLGNPNAFIFMNKEPRKDKSTVWQAAQLGSPEALKILAKTSTSAETEARTVEKGKAEYGMMLNRMI